MAIAISDLGEGCGARNDVQSGVMFFGVVLKLSDHICRPKFIPIHDEPPTKVDKL